MATHLCPYCGTPIAPSPITASGVAVRDPSPLVHSMLPRLPTRPPWPPPPHGRTETADSPRYRNDSVRSQPISESLPDLRIHAGDDGSTPPRTVTVPGKASSFQVMPLMKCARGRIRPRRVQLSRGLVRGGSVRTRTRPAARPGTLLSALPAPPGDPGKLSALNPVGGPPPRFTYQEAPPPGGPPPLPSRYSRMTRASIHHRSLVAVYLVPPRPVQTGGRALSTAHR